MQCKGKNQLKMVIIANGTVCHIWIPHNKFNFFKIKEHLIVFLYLSPILLNYY